MFSINVLDTLCKVSNMFLLFCNSQQRGIHMYKKTIYSGVEKFFWGAHKNDLLTHKTRLLLIYMTFLCNMALKG